MSEPRVRVSAPVVEQTLRISARPDGSSLVEVVLTAEGDGTVMTLRHTGIPPAHADEHRSGWGHFLPLLASAASGYGGSRS